MDKRLLPYFESVNDGSAQGDYLSEFGPKEVQGGICLHLVITWMYFYKNDAQNTAPNIIWQHMKQPVVIKQIAQNHLAYKETIITELHNVETNVDFYKIISTDPAGPIAVTLDGLYPMSDNFFRISNMLLLCIDLERDGKLVGRHAIGIIRHNDRIYMYDPNEGVLSVNIGSEEELFGLIKYIYEIKAPYNVTNIEVYPIN